MNNEELENYIKKRYSEYLKYYDKNAKLNKICNDFCTIYILLASIAIVPLLSIDLLFPGKTQLWAIILAPTVALVAGIKSHKRFYENWLNYRRTWDNLQKEYYLRKTDAGIYKNSKDKNVLFVERIEDLIAEEGSNWISCHKNEKTNNQ